ATPSRPVAQGSAESPRADDRAGVQARVQSIVDACYADHGEADPRLSGWQVRFKMNPKGKLKGLWATPTSMVESTPAFLTAQCVRQEIKAVQWGTPATTAKFVAAFQVSQDLRPPELVGGTTLVFRSVDGEWIDVRVH